MTFPLCWNTFVACAGTFIPIVWLRFIKEGLACWPYEVIFIWFWIFAMELTAVSCSVTHFAIERSGDKEKARNVRERLVGLPRGKKLSGIDRNNRCSKRPVY
eukprot:scaffold1355_cov106-Skeletonema_dohrnii-CCMP3373.AAC.2